MSSPPHREDFEYRLRSLLRAAAARGERVVTIRSGDLHREVGGYPATNHRMPVCCDVMRAAVGPADRVVAEPPSGRGANLFIEYRVPVTGDEGGR